MPIQYMPITNEAEWLEKKRHYVTSTEVSALYNVNPYMTNFELWHIKRGNIEPPMLDNNFITFGKLIEPVVAEMVRIENPDWIIEPCKVFAYDDEIKMGSSFDYWVTINGTKGLMEIKSTSYKKYKSSYTEDGDFIESPLHYEIQAQVELEMMPEAEFIVQVAFLADTRTLKYIHRERSKEMGKKFRSKIQEFWNSSEPEPDYSRDKSLIAKLAPSIDPKNIIDATENTVMTELCAQYKSEKEIEKRAKENADAYYAEIMKLAGTAKTIWTKYHKVSLADIKPSEGTLVTAEMVGTHINACSGYKRMTISDIA